MSMQSCCQSDQRNAPEVVRPGPFLGLVAWNVAVTEGTLGLNGSFTSAVRSVCQRDVSSVERTALFRCVAELEGSWPLPQKHAIRLVSNPVQ